MISLTTAKLSIPTCKYKCTFFQSENHFTSNYFIINFRFHFVSYLTPKKQKMSKSEFVEKTKKVFLKFD